MIWVYLFIIGVPAFLVLVTIIKMRKANKVLRQGIKTFAVITSIKLMRYHKGRADSIVLQYRDNNNIDHIASATVSPGKYKRGDKLKISYLEDKPGEYALEDMHQGYWAMLIFSILLLAFTIFASYKLNEMVTPGNY
jgi:hypothetical protein